MAHDRDIDYAAVAVKKAIVEKFKDTALEDLQTVAGERTVKNLNPIFDVRLRHEHVSQTPLVEDANATTLRARFGFETAAVWDTSFLAEGEWVQSIVRDFNSTTNGRGMFPVVADPNALELYRCRYPKFQ